MFRAIVSVDGSLSFAVNVDADSEDEAESAAIEATQLKARNRGYQGISSELIAVEQVYPI